MKILSFRILKRVAILYHPFFILFFAITFQSYVELKPTTQAEKAYYDFLSLKFSSGLKNIAESRKLQPNNNFYLLSENYYDVLNILISDNPISYSVLKKNESRRLEILDKESTQSPWKKLIQAEIRFQWALVKLKFNDEISAAWDLKQAYSLLQENRKSFPTFIHNQKLQGIFEIMLGSIPEKYNWLPSTIGLKGSIDTGMNDLRKVENSKSLFSLEAAMYRIVIENFILKKETCSADILEKYLKQYPDNLLLRYLTASVLIKEGETNTALTILDKKDKQKEHIVFPMIELLKGDIFLYKSDYTAAARQFQLFLQSTKGTDQIKNANYKMFLCYWLSDQKDKANVWLDKARKEGRTIYDADIYADRFARQQELPDKSLVKSRLACDGGYMELAINHLRKYCIKTEPKHRDNIEFYYRKGRIYQLQNNISEAKGNYLKTIALSEGKKYYFAPNACLQLGYIYMDERNIAAAKKYFNKALQYKDHEYKNGIDNKARAALNKLEN